ncbi:MAG: response regulator [Kamptonema sp. SIO1D9]|nr:response regulator [Kamptonema sp. SIO1D9]
MEKEKITFEEALEFVQKKVYLQTNNHLSLQEETILKGAWEESSYEEIGESLYLSSGYVRNSAASLWKTLSKVFQQKITKSQFHYLICKIISEEEITPPFFEEEEEEESQLDKGSILLVDDQVENLQILSKLLKENGYQVRSANGGNIALRSLEKILPDLILLDILMPNLNGYEVCKILKKQAKTALIPVIFISALNEPIDKIKAFELGGSDYITKPFELQEVLARVSCQITLRKQRIQLEAEIKQHQQTIEILYQSRSILASILNYSYHGIAAFEAIRSPVDAEITDFRCLLVNPAFAECFNLTSSQLMTRKSCLDFFKANNLDWLEGFIKVIKTGKTFQQKFYYQNKVYQVFAVKLGDGITLTLQPLLEKGGLSG